MADEQEYASKRERQKARRAQRLEEEAQQAAAANRNRTLTYGVVVVAVLALIGGLIFNAIRSGQEADALAEEVAGRLDELGCTPDERQPDLGGGHIAGDPAALAAEPPDVIYPDQPPSSGRHIGQVVPSGVFDQVIDPRFTTHNQEHGYIIAHYDADAPADQVEELKAWAQEQIDGDFPKIVVAEYYTDLPNDANFAYTAWFHRQACETFDSDVALVFSRAHYDTNGEGPERGIPGHAIGQQGVVEPPEDGSGLLLPPLDVAVGGEAVDVTDEENVSPETDPDEGGTPPVSEDTE